MLVTRNECVGCETCTLGSGCSLLNAVYRLCDVCDPEDEVEANYRIDGTDMCRDCAEEYLREAFNELSICEMAEALDISYEEIG